MSFAENLRALRKEKGISQEELAELLEVSRQAVSKWEQGAGYPEMETMIRLSSKLKVSIDRLLRDETEMEEARPQRGESPAGGEITIRSRDGTAIVSCYKVQSSPVFKHKKNEPCCALFGVSGPPSFWGESSTLLGWYASEEDLQKETEAILAALRRGDGFYDLQPPGQRAASGASGWINRALPPCQGPPGHEKGNAKRRSL